MATLKELAERTGYAPATISRILSGDPTLAVTPEARRKVLEEAGRLNYSQTRSRRGRSPKTVLRLGVAEMLTPAQQLDDPYYLYLGSLVRQGCMDRRYSCVPLESQSEAFFVPEGERLDGIIAIGLFTPRQIDSLSALSPNVVFLDSSPFESRFDSVVPGYELGVSLAMEHLTTMNHRRIGFVGPAVKFNDRRQKAPEIRRQHFIRRMEAFGLSEQMVLLDCPMTVEDTVRAWEGYLRSGQPLPGAVLCANEENAIGTLKYLLREGYGVPGNVSVVSFNDTPRSALISPSLTSVSLQVQEMASTALRLVYERAVFPGKQPVRTVPLKVVVPPCLVVRESSGAVCEDGN